ncbi:MAG: FAD-dependent oxidoreductase, partial [Chloroflexota bacterium]
PILKIGVISIFLLCISVLIQAQQFIQPSQVLQPALISAQKEYDVVIVGAGTGGISAAIQASRMGMKVALLEETDVIGGQMIAAAVSTMDNGYHTRDYPSGIYQEFENRIRNYYSQINQFKKGILEPKSVGTCYWNDNTTCFEPSVGQGILLKMIAEQKPRLDLYLLTQVTGVQVIGSNCSIVGNCRVVGVTTADGTIFKSKVLIDATEYGDIIPLTPARYRAGNSTSDHLNLKACVQMTTYIAIIKKYPSGTPNQFLFKGALTGINEKDAFFSKFLSPLGTSWTVNGKISNPMTLEFFNGYRGLPDSTNPHNYTARSKEEVSKITKTSVNRLNDYRYSVKDITDKKTRELDNCNAKFLTLQNIYFIQQVYGAKNWAIANDEPFNGVFNTTKNICADFPDSLKTMEKYMPVMPYVRESRRIIGLQTLTAKDIQVTGKAPNIYAVKNSSSAIAQGDYIMDLHSCNSSADLESDLESLQDAIFTQPGYFQIPMETLIPETVDGFLAAEKNISQSRLVNGATRTQSGTMSIGQAAGALAAVAIRNGKQPRKVSSVDVQFELLRSHARLSLFVYDDIALPNKTQGQENIVPDPLYPYVELVSLHELMGPYHNQYKNSVAAIFAPNSNLTRGEVAQILVKRAHLSLLPKPKSSFFSDVTFENPLYSEIYTAFDAKIVTECGKTLDGTPLFCPNRPVTRGEFAEMLVKSLKLPLAEAQGVSPFADVAINSSNYKYILTLFTSHILDGSLFSCKKGNFCPDEILLRKDAAIYLAHSLLFVQ